jgi:copper(I)-binding protein
MKSFLTKSTGLVLLLFLSSASAGDLLDITGSWIREAPPTSSVLAAYMTLRNRSDTAVNIISISSPDFAQVEMHRTVVEGGMARMLPVAVIEVPVTGELVLEPGGLHLMLIEPKHPLTEGDFVKLYMELGNGPCITLTVPVIHPGAADTDQQEHHHHH